MIYLPQPCLLKSYSTLSPIHYSHRVRILRNQHVHVVVESNMAKWEKSSSSFSFPPGCFFSLFFSSSLFLNSRKWRSCSSKGEKETCSSKVESWWMWVYCRSPDESTTINNYIAMVNKSDFRKPFVRECSVALT